MSFLIALALIVGLVWATVLVVRGSLMGGCLLFLLVNACFGYFFFHKRVGPVELTADRLVLMLLTGSYFVHRALRRTEPKPLGTADYVTFAFLGWLAVRTFTADWRDSGGDGPAPYWHLIIGYLSPLWLFWIARQSKLDRKSIRLLHACCIGFGVYLGISAFLEITHQWWAVFPRHIADPEAGLHFGRARGPMVQSIVFGFCLSICAFCTWTSRHLVSPGRPWLPLLLLPLMLAGIYFSYTRCVWMGAAGGLALIAALTLPWRLRLVTLGGAATVGLLVAIVSWDSLVGFDGGRSAGETRDSTSMRTTFAYVSYQMAMDHPVFGCGFGQYLGAVGPYLEDRSTNLSLGHIRDHLHHITPLSILVETGVIGLGLFLAMLAAWARDAWRLWNSAAAPDWMRAHGLLMLGLLIAYFANALFQPVGHMNIVHMILFFFVGISSGMARVAIPRTANRTSLTNQSMSPWQHATAPS